MIADLARKNRLPSMNEASDFVDTGGLIFYFTNDVDVFRQKGDFNVDKILKGTKPEDLPVERPTKFEFSSISKPPSRSA